jgi:hypothetical protein
MRWPWIIAVSLGIVVLVDGVFVYTAVTGADEVSASYEQEAR